MSRKGKRGKTDQFVARAKVAHLIKQNEKLVKVAQDALRRCGELSDALVQTFKMANEFAGGEGHVVDGDGLRKWIAQCTKIPEHEEAGSPVDEDVGGDVPVAPEGLSGGNDEQDAEG